MPDYDIDKIAEMLRLQRETGEGPVETLERLITERDKYRELVRGFVEGLKDMQGAL